MRKYPEFWKVVQRIRREDAAAFPYRIRLVPKICASHPTEVTWGDSVLRGSEDDRFFRIRIAKKTCKDEASMITVLLEEVAHARNWSHLHDQQDDPDYHNDAFWLEYGRLRRKYLGEK